MRQGFGRMNRQNGRRGGMQMHLSVGTRCMSVARLGPFSWSVTRGTRGLQMDPFWSHFAHFLCVGRVVFENHGRETSGALVDPDLLRGERANDGVGAFDSREGMVCFGQRHARVFAISASFGHGVDHSMVFGSIGQHTGINLASEALTLSPLWRNS